MPTLPCLDCILNITGLRKVYEGGVEAVRGIDLCVQRGEIFALLGPNGAGKTTTIKIAVTLAQSTAGTVTVDGFDVATSPDEARRRIGYVGQEVAVDKSLTARENLELQAALYHIPSSELAGRVQEVLELVELADRADDRVKTYSGGMKKRLDIACGLLHRPRLLVLDEPTLGLDIQTRTRIWDYIRRMRAGGTTVLMTTHYMEEADRLCDRVAIIDHGTIQAIGTPHELKARVGGDVVTLTVPATEMKRVPGDLEPRLRALPFVREMSLTDQIVLYVEPGENTVPRVFEAVSATGLKVDEFTYSRPTLDDVFLKFTGHSMRD